MSEIQHITSDLMNEELEERKRLRNNEWLSVHLQYVCVPTICCVQGSVPTSGKDLLEIRSLFALFEARHRDQGMLCLHQVVLCEVWRVQNKLIMSNSDTYFLSTG